MKETYKSRVYTDRPAYADFDPPHKFQAIISIVEKRLMEHPNAICSLEIRWVFTNKIQHIFG